MDYFKSFNPETIKLNKNNDTITHNKYATDHSCYGFQSIPSTSTSIYKWTFKIIKQRCYNTISIGIDEDKNQWINHDFSEQDGTINYSYCSNGKKCHSGKEEDYGPIYSDNDLISMILDFSSSNGSIYFLKNNKNIGVAYKNIKKHKKKKYKMCISTFIRGDCIKLIDYQCDDSNNNDDDKKNNDDNDDNNDNIIHKKIVDSLTKQIENLKVQNMLIFFICV